MSLIKNKFVPSSVIPLRISQAENYSMRKERNMLGTRLELGKFVELGEITSQLCHRLPALLWTNESGPYPNRN